MHIFAKSYLKIVDRFFLQEDIGTGISKIICLGLCLQDVKTTASVWIRILRKGITDFIQTWIASNMRSYLFKKKNFIFRCTNTLHHCLYSYYISIGSCLWTNNTILNVLRSIKTWNLSWLLFEISLVILLINFCGKFSF